MRAILFAAAMAAGMAAASAQESGQQPPAPASPAPEAAAPGPSAPSAGAENADVLARCLIAHSGQPESEAMRRVMVAALSDDTPGLKNALSDFSGLLMKLSMNSCDVGLSRFEDPAFRAVFQQASSRYGAVLGEKLMQDAFAKLN